MPATKILKGRIDLHAHVLPRLDDGPKTPGDAPSLIRRAVHEPSRGRPAQP